jgi:hypothetical protein
MTDGPVSKGNGNGNSATLPAWARFALQLAREHGITALMAIALLGLVIKLMIIDSATNKTAHDALVTKQAAIETSVGKNHDDVKAMNSVMSRMVVLLESIDKQLCIQNAGDDRSRQRECVAPR